MADPLPYVSRRRRHRTKAGIPNLPALARALEDATRDLAAAQERFRLSYAALERAIAETAY
jgi:hypothetical protein